MSVRFLCHLLVCLVVNRSDGFFHSQSRCQYLRRSSNVFMEVAPYKKARRQNIDGNLYVDESCIDCDVCRWMCPNVYARKGIKSAVIKQPINDDEKLQAYAAMVACPVGSIRVSIPDPLTKQAIDVFPSEVTHKVLSTKNKYNGFMKMLISNYITDRS